MSTPGLTRFLVISLLLHAVLIGYSMLHRQIPMTSAGPLQVTLHIRNDRPPGKTQASMPDTAPARQPGRTPVSRKPVSPSAASLPRPATQIPATHAGRIPQPAAADWMPQKPEPATTPAALATGAIEARLQGQLREALLPHMSYPLLARRRGWEGTVKVSVRVESDGELSRLHLVGSSRYGVLDKAAMKSLRQVTRIPAAAAWLGGQHFDMVLPVEYRLLDS